VLRVRSANSRSGVIGCSARSSFTTNVASSSAPATNETRVRAAVQPLVAAETKP
jgi:hypothetical protein